MKQPEEAISLRFIRAAAPPPTQPHPAIQIEELKDEELVMLWNTIKAEGKRKPLELRNACARTSLEMIRRGYGPAMLEAMATGAHVEPV